MILNKDAYDELKKNILELKAEERDTTEFIEDLIDKCINLIDTIDDMSVRYQFDMAEGGALIMDLESKIERLSSRLKENNIPMIEDFREKNKDIDGPVYYLVIPEVFNGTYIRKRIRVEKDSDYPAVCFSRNILNEETDLGKYNEDSEAHLYKISSGTKKLLAIYSFSEEVNEWCSVRNYV